MYLITPFLPNERNGVSKSLRLLLSKLNKEKKEIKIITSKPYNKEFYNYVQEKNIEYIPLGIKNLINPISYLISIKKYLKIIKGLKNTDLICICWHTSLTNILSLFTNSIDDSVNIFFYSHGTNSTLGALPISLKSIIQIPINFLYRKTLMKKLLDRCTNLFVLSNTYDSRRIDDIKYLIYKNPDKIILTANEIENKEKIHKKNNFSRSIPIFVIACRPTRQKGLHYLKKIINKIDKQLDSSEVKFLLCMPDKFYKKNNILDKLNSDKIVRKYLKFQYNCDEKDLKNIYLKKNTYFISLSRCEYEPYGLIEPLILGCPSFAFPAGGIKHFYGVNLYKSIDEICFYIKSIVCIKGYRERLYLSSKVASHYFKSRETIGEIINF